MRITSTFGKLDHLQPSKILLLFGAIISILWSVCFALVTISIPYQIEFREGTAQVLTGLFLQGQNPFILDHQPLAMNNYGIGYNLVALPFAALFGNTLPVHRSVTFLFILLSALLGCIIVYEKTGEDSLAVSAAAFIMLGLIGYGGIGAFPGSLGTFLFLLAILVPFLRSFDFGSLVFSALIAILAFYTKPYFLLAFGTVCSYVFLFESKKKSIIYGLLFLIPFSLSLWVMSRLFPLYFINTIIGNVSNTYLSFDHLMAQLKDLLFSFAPVLLFLLLFILPNRLKKGFQITSTDKSPLLNIADWKSPFVVRPFNYLLYTFFCSFLAFVFILGPHIGNYLNYAYQLVIPTFFCWFFCQIALEKKASPVLVLAVLSTLFIWSSNTVNPQMLKQKDSAEWAKLFDYVHSSETVLNSPAVTSEIIAAGKMPIDSGQTSYFYRVQPFAPNFLVQTPYEDFHIDGNRYTFTIDRMIRKQQFDLVITTKGKSSFYHDVFTGTYSQVEEITVDMPQADQQWTLVIWKPIIK